MKFLIPLGLIALIAIPIIIIIYIIKPKYQEKKISSTYIWKLSLNYKKRRIPFSWLSKSLLLIVQLLAAAVMAFMIAKPIIFKESKSNEKIIIIDASCSMNATKNNQSRFERAIAAIEKNLSTVNEKNKVSIIVATETPYYLAKQETSKNVITYALESLKCGYESANIEDAVSLASEVLDINNDALVYLYTDTTYNESGYVNVVDVSNKEYNVSISNFTYKIQEGYYVFEADVSSYNSKTEAKLLFNLNDGFKYKTIDLDLKENETKHILIDNLGIASANNVKLSIVEKDSPMNDYVLVTDSYPYDNEMAIYNIEPKKFKTLIVGSETTFIYASCLSSGISDVLAIDPTESEVKNEGYDLYIYDHYYPTVLPSDGNILIINPINSDDRLNFRIKNIITTKGFLEATGSDSNTYNKIMNNVAIYSNSVSKYQELTLLSDFEVMITCNGNPILLTSKYNKADIAVLALDLHYSDLPLSANLPMLMNNLMNYLLNDTVLNYNCNYKENNIINSKVNSINTTLNDITIYDEMNDSLSYSFDCTKLGVNKVVQQLSNNKERVDYFFVEVNESESNFIEKGDYLAPENYNSASINANKEKVYDEIDIIAILAAVLLALVMVEWGLAIYEKN